MAIMTDEGGNLVAGRYRLAELVGQGGMGRVWRARDQLLNREVAVKEILVPQGGTEEQQHEFTQHAVREAQAAARLNHSGIITVHDVLLDQQKPLIIMELVPGHSLAEEIVQTGKLDWEQVARIGAALADALAHAHAAGIVHRDIKPGNVLLAGDRVVLTDFGIARILDASLRLTASGTLAGTPQYMPPEQIDGEPVQAPGDMWALGATLYAAVEGHPPFDYPTLSALWAAILARPAPQPQHAGPMSSVLSDLLSKEPGKRPDAQATAARLAALLNASSNAVRDVPVPVPAGTTPAQGAGDFQWLRTETSRALVGTPASPVELNSPVTARKARTLLWPHADNISDMAFSVDGNLLAACGRNGSFAVWDTATAALRCQGSQEIIADWMVKGPILASAVAFSPDQRQIALAADTLYGRGQYGTGRSAVQLRDSASGQLRASLSAPCKGSPFRNLTSVSFTNDGSIAAFSVGVVQVLLWDAATGTMKSMDLKGRTAAELKSEMARMRHPIQGSVFSPGMTSLVTTHHSETLHLWDPMSGKHRHSITSSDAQIGPVTFSSDGRTLAMAVWKKAINGMNSAIEFRDCQTGKVTTTLNRERYAEQVTALAVHRRLLVACGTGPLELWDTATGQQLGNLEPAAQGQDHAACISFSQNGRFLAAGAQLWELA